jgi:WD40 repeat protein
VKHRNLIRFIAVLGLWLLGLAVIWWLTPVGPRDGWTLPKGETVIGFLADGQTLLTTPISAGHRQLMEDRPTGIVRLWDIESGQLIASHFAPEDGGEQFFLHDYRFEVIPRHDLILLEKTVDVMSQQSRAFRLSLHDGFSGKKVTSFSRIGFWDPRYRFNDPFQQFGSLTVSPDGRAVAIVNFDGNRPRVEFRDMNSGSLIHSLAGWREPICFAPDSSRFAIGRIEQASNGGVISTIGVFESATGRQLGSFAHHHPAIIASDPVWRPKEFSPRGDQLIDTVGQVWDLATSKVQCKIAGAMYGSCHFTPDGRFVVAVSGSKTQSWLAYYDAVTGQEVVKRRLPLFTGAKPEAAILPVTPDKQLMLAVGTPQYRNTNAIAEWLGRIPGLGHLRRSTPDQPFVILDTGSGCEILRGDGAVCGCSPDGRFLVTIGATGAHELWDIPPARPLSTFLPWAFVWSAAWGLFLWWRVLRRVHARNVAAASTQAASNES